jgi:hypothetical protein
MTVRLVRTWLGLACAMTAACTEAPTSPTSPVGGAASAASTTAAATSTTATTSTSTTTPATAASPTGMSLRFHGNPTAEVDQIKVPIDPQVAADLGGDLTVEFWLKTEPGANPAMSCQAGSDGWTYGNVILDRDVFGTGDYGEYGVSLSGGRIAFGVGRAGRQQTICGLIDVADGRWHHVALTRRFADGVMRIYVDGTESAQGIGPAGDISYRDGRPTGVSSDPFLIIGASKSDEGTGSNGFSGALDELRLSSSIRYSSPFDRPLAPFVADAETALLFHFDEGPTGPCLSSVLDTSGRATHGQCRHGGSASPGPLYEADAPFLPPRQRTWLLGTDGKPIALAPADGSTTTAPGAGTPAAPSEPPPTPNVR